MAICRYLMFYPWLCIIWPGNIFWTQTLGVGWGHGGGCLITIPFVHGNFRVGWFDFRVGWFSSHRTCTSCKMYGSSKFRPSGVSWDVLRGILLGSWQMGQTRHGFPWVPKSWVGHSCGIWVGHSLSWSYYSRYSHVDLCMQFFSNFAWSFHL